MSRLIDADAVIEKCSFYKGWSEKADYEIQLVKDILNETPTVDAERHGHWIGIDDEPCETYECDKCGYITEEIGCNNGTPNNFKYCPNCGAKMDETGEEE